MVVVEALLEHGEDVPAVTAAARRVLQAFVAVARDPRYVPGERARQALVDTAEQLLSQLPDRRTQD